MGVYFSLAWLSFPGTRILYGVISSSSSVNKSFWEVDVLLLEDMISLCLLDVNFLVFNISDHCGACMGNSCLIL